jgi:pyrimidine-nucleoside phosphorylase
VIITKPSKPCAKYKIIKHDHKEIDLSLLWRHPVFLKNIIPSKDSFEREILRWRTATTERDHEIPPVTILSYNELEDKISLILVPLLASAGVRVLKLLWSDELSGQALHNNLLSISGVTLPSNPEDIHRILERTGGVYAAMPEFTSVQHEAPHRLGRDKMTRFKVNSLFAIYAARWSGIAADIRIGDYSHQIKASIARNLAMDLKEHCDAAGLGSSFFICNENQLLGYALGPVLEFQEALDVLQAKGPLDLTKMALEVGADLLMCQGQFSHRTEAKSFLKNQLLSGDAHARFKEIIQSHMSEEEVLENFNTVPPARREFRIVSHKKGYIERIAMDRLLELKQRLCRENQGAGLLLLKKIGDTTDKNDTLARAHLPSSWETESIQAEVQDIFTVSRFPPEFQPQIAEKIKGSFRF